MNTITQNQAIEKIKKTLEGFDINSPLRAAFEGVLEIAESNVKGDECCSLFCRLQLMEKENDELKAVNKKLKAELEAEQEWRVIMDDSDILRSICSEKRYSEIFDDGVILNDIRAAEKISLAYGFPADRIKILHYMYRYERNRHNEVRISEHYVRNPIWNNSKNSAYIFFKVLDHYFEILDNNLSEFHPCEFILAKGSAKREESCV